MRHLICVSSLWLCKSRTPGFSWLFTVSILKESIRLSWGIPKAFRYCSRTLWDAWMLFTRGEKEPRRGRPWYLHHTNPEGTASTYVFGGPGHACCQTALSSHQMLAASYCSTYLHPPPGTVWCVPLRDGSQRSGKTMIWSLYFLQKNNYLGQNQTKLG